MMAATERMKIWIGSVLLALLCPVQGSICKGVEEPIPISMLSTKTAYRAVPKDTSHWAKFEEEVSDCEAKQIWLLVRHGTRYPTKNDMGDLVALLPRLGRHIAKNFIYGRGCLNEEIVRKLENWIIPYEIWDREQLHEVGSDELFEMGEYWRNMYPHLLKGPYHPDHFKVEFTVKNRTGQSAYHFLRGLFGDDEIGTIELPKPFEPNFVLRFYKACPRWLKEVYRNNKTTYKERNLFKQTQLFQGVLHAVSARLGFLYVLSSAEVLAMYDECRYESAWWPHVSSPWCAAFTQHELEVMEYYQDLKYYYEDSYGHPLNTETACRTIGDLYTHLRTTVYEGQSPRGIFYFTHDKAILKVLAILGLFRPDQHLRNDNYEQMRDRAWRTSIVSPFAANIAFVLYKCGSSHRVATFFHGQPIPLLKSCDGISCLWEDIKPFLAKVDQECDLSKLCMLHDEL